MKLEWNYKEAQYGRYWLELSNEEKIITKILLIDCKNDPLNNYSKVKFRYNGIIISNDVSIDEAMRQVENYLLEWWKKNHIRAERDYYETMEIVDFLEHRI